MRIAVVGAAGFIGKRLCPFLRGLGHDVWGYDIQNGENILQGDWSVVNADELPDKIDVIVHLAAWPHEGPSFKAPTRTYRDGLLTLARTCEIAALGRVARVVYASTISVYGNGQGWHPPWDESVPPRPRSPYGHAKLAGEHLLRCMAKRYGFENATLRFGQIYGPGMPLNDKGRAVIAIFMSSLRHDEPMPLVGTGEHRRSFLYVDDLCAAIERTCTREKWGLGSVNVASDEPVSIRTLAKMIAETGGFSTALSERPGGIACDAYLDSSLAVRELGLTSRPLVVGLGQTWKWVKSVPLLDWQASPLPLDGV